MNEVFTCMGSYAEGGPILLRIRQDGGADSAQWSVLRLEKELLSGWISVSQAEQDLVLPPLAKGGYGVRVRLFRKETLLASLHTAVNVGGDFVRYGFLCDFGQSASEAVPTLAKYHITHVQFYDWSWKHDSLVSPREEYRDMMGKRNSLPVIQRRIDACHRHGMLAMAYGAVYAASREFRDAHPAWGLYGPEQEPLVFIDTFYYMDISGPWRDHLINEYKKAVTSVGFDGIHMDTYGEPKTAFTLDGEKRALRDGFPALIRDTHAAFLTAGIHPHLIFNNVGTWPAEATRDCPQDAVYMELWPPMDRYLHLRAAVQKAGRHPVVLAAYPAAFRTDDPERALYSQLLLSFAIALLGASQLFIGETNAVVTQGYYVDSTPLNEEQIPRIRAYEDFFVRYGDLFFDRTMEDVTYTHFGGDNTEYRMNVPCSPDGEPERIWITIRENDKRKMIGLVNLCGNPEDRWNTGKNRPIPRQDLVLRFLADKAPASVWYASPDLNAGEPVPLCCTHVSLPGGTEVSCILPSLFCCGLVWVQCG